MDKIIAAPKKCRNLVYPLYRWTKEKKKKIFISDNKQNINKDKTSRREKKN